MSYFYIETKIDDDVYKEAIRRYCKEENKVIKTTSAHCYGRNKFDCALCRHELDSEAFNNPAFVKHYYDVLLEKHDYIAFYKDIDNWNPDATNLANQLLALLFDADNEYKSVSVNEMCTTCTQFILSNYVIKTTAKDIANFISEVLSVFYKIMNSKGYEFVEHETTQIKVNNGIVNIEYIDIVNNAFVKSEYILFKKKKED